MKKIEFDNICCGKEMVEISLNDGNKWWVCSVCGGYYKLIEDQLDEEDLENLKQNYPEEFGIEEENDR